MDITFLGQSAFRLRGKEVSIVTDPYPAKNGMTMGKVQADIISFSRPLGAHSAAQAVGGDPRVVSGPGEYEIADVLIAGVATEVEPRTGPVNTAYIFRFDDIAVCHLGAMRSKLADAQVESIGNIDVLLIPVGGGGALGPSQAAEVVTQLEPSVIIPMRYRLDGTAGSLEPVDLFCREMGTKEFVPESKLTVTKSSLAQEVRVVVLEQKRV